MLKLEQIQKMLVSANLAEVSRSTGLHVQSLYKIRDGACDVKHSSLVKLSNYFEGKENDTTQRSLNSAKK